MAQKIRFTLFTDFKTNLEESPIYVESVKEVPRLTCFLRKWFCICGPNLSLYSLEPIFHGSEDSIYALCRLQNKFIGNSSIRKMFLEHFKLCFAFPEKWFCIRQGFVFIFESCTNSIAQRVLFRLSEDFRTRF